MSLPWRIASLLSVLVGLTLIAQFLLAGTPLSGSVTIVMPNAPTRTYGTDYLFRYDPNLIGKTLVKKSVIFTIEDLVLTDPDGSGKLKGAGNASGVINYTNGAFYLNFDVLKKGPITVTYQYLAEEPSEHEGGDITPAAEREGLPIELQGQFPIHMPTYQGVEQLLLLSNRWLILVTSNLEEVSREIQTLVAQDPPLYAKFSPRYTGPNFFLDAQSDWEKSIYHNWLWNVRRELLDPSIEKYVVQARENAGERLLDQASYYTIRSATDPQYQTAAQPTRATRFIVSRGGERVGGFEIDYAHYSYIELPHPLVNGETYTVSIGNGKQVTFLYDELRTVARTIKVNQVGYLPDAPHKYAYLSGYLQEFGPMDLSYATSFKVIDVHTGATLLEGPVQLREANPLFTQAAWKGTPSTPLPPMTGEDVYEIDLSALKTPGTYFLSIPNVGRSWPFKVESDIYGDAFYNAMRGMYAQRCGIALTRDISAWTRAQCHAGPTYESQALSTDLYMQKPADYDNFNVIGYKIDRTHSTPGPVFGWHDAADWDKHNFHYSNIFALLTLYEIMPQKFRDNQLHIPESGNGIPDILDEAEFGLQVWRKSMTHLGGAAGTWETSTHPSMDDPNYPYAFGLRARWLSLLYATAAAQLAQLFKQVDPVLLADKIALYTAEAKKAYAYGIDPAHSLGTITIDAATDRGKGTPYQMTYTENEKDNLPYLASAKLRLYLLSIDPETNPLGDVSYLSDLPDLLQKVPAPGVWPDALWDYTSFLYFGLFSPTFGQVVPQLDPEMRQGLERAVTRFRSIYFDTANTMKTDAARDPYRRAKSRDEQEQLAWGLGVMTNRSKWLLQAHHVSGLSDFKEVALYNTDYQMGTNPQGMMWTTGSGFVYPIHIQHTISEEDPIMDPFPGIVPYGPTNQGWKLIDSIWLPKKPNGEKVKFLSAAYWEGDELKLPPVLRRYATHPTLLTDQNEFTIHETMASGLFALGYLMKDNWMPSEALKQRLPREDSLLFGYWYLP